jgi:hypothetical protein
MKIIEAFVIHNRFCLLKTLLRKCQSKKIQKVTLQNMPHLS